MLFANMYTLHRMSLYEASRPTLDNDTLAVSPLHTLICRNWIFLFLAILAYIYS